MGLVFLSHLGFITGQMAGLSLIISYVTGWSFGVVFWVANLPFYWFTYKRLGLRFTIKSAICVGTLSVMVDILPQYIQFSHLDPLIGTLACGALTGSGLLAIIRHEGSLGGVGAMALTIQEMRAVFRAAMCNRSSTCAFSRRPSSCCLFGWWPGRSLARSS